MHKHSLQKVVVVLLFLIVLISGCSSGPSDEEASRLISQDIGWSSYDADVTVVGKEKCRTISGDQAKGIAERWLVIYRIENYKNPETEYTALLIKKNGQWDVERRGGNCP
jgi:hypothetical protein